MKTVKESEEISCISLQSSRSSFRKIRIFKFAYSALPLFLFLGKVIEQRNRTVVTLDMFISVHDYSFRFFSFRFAKYSKTNRVEYVSFVSLACLRNNLLRPW